MVAMDEIVDSEEGTMPGVFSSMSFFSPHIENPLDINQKKYFSKTSWERVSLLINQR
jgi:hypothetical protein